MALDEDSSFLTTFSSLFGRFKWLHLPFGISVAAEIFQKKLNQVIGDLPGVLCVPDDILIYGVGETTVEAVKDHDKKMLSLLKTCEEAGIRLNKEKIQLHHKSIPFLGHLITDEGLPPFQISTPFEYYISWWSFLSSPFFSGLEQLIDPGRV